MTTDGSSAEARFAGAPDRTISPDLVQALERVAREPELLVVSDYDGTIAPIVRDPSQARPWPGAIRALGRIAELPRTHAAMISGRSRADLAALSGAPDSILLVGSHGAEFDPGFERNLPAPARALHERLRRELGEIASSDQGLAVEVKPASVAFHYRNADESAARDALDRVFDGPAALAGVTVKKGKCVVELGVVKADKGQALLTLQRRLGATAVVFLGDDATDEDAFAVLSGADVGVKVGPGDTRAQFRVADTPDVQVVLDELAERRARAVGAA